MTTNAEVNAADTSRVFHSWSAQNHLDPMPIKTGKGARVWDFDGNEYIDLTSMLVNVNIGHQHPKVVEAIQQQAAELTTVAPAHTNPTRARAAELILSHAPDGFSKVFFTNGGADAVENAIRLARLTTGRDKVLSNYRSYHGNTGAAIVATGDWRRQQNEYARGHVHFFAPYLYRSEFHAETEQQECERALQHLERVIQADGADAFAAILIETIPGTGGIIVPPQGYLEGVREIADRYGIKLILDEVMAGFGRTGEWFAFNGFGVKPDLITFAKGVNSGYVPLGGVIISEDIASQFDDRVFPGGLTYSGHPLASAAAVATIEAMEEEGIVEHARHLGADIIGPRLRELASKHEVIGDVRGRGVFWAVEFVANRDTREPMGADWLGNLKQALLDRGVLPMISEHRLHFVPPCVITDEDARRALDIIDEALAAL